MFRVENSVVVERSTSDVFALVSDPRNDPSWYTDVVEVTQTGGEGIGAGSTFRWVLEFFGHKDVEMTIIGSDPDRRVDIEVHWAPKKAVFNWVVQPIAGGTKLTRIVQVTTCTMPRATLPIMRKVLQRRDAAFLANLKALLEGTERTAVPAAESMLPEEAQYPAGAF